jgi:predicted Na+-dependent transporter
MGPCVSLLVIHCHKNLHCHFLLSPFSTLYLTTLIRMGVGVSSVMAQRVEAMLNLFGYSLSFLTKLVSKQRETFLPMLFLVSSKEFGIASAAVATMRLDTALVIPSAFYEVVQMISSPIMVRVVKRVSRQENRE